MPRRKPTPEPAKRRASGPEEQVATPEGYSDYRVTRDGGIRRVSTGRVLRPSMGTDGYMLVSLMHDDGRKRTVRVHTVVLLAWIGPRPLAHEGCHVDGDRHNNAASNLRWATRETNEQHKGRASDAVRSRMRDLPRRSGPTQTPEARRAAGRTRIEAWLPTALVARLDAYRGELSRREALEAGVTLLLREAKS